jgi:hypothetical protein
MIVTNPTPINAIQSMFKSVSLSLEEAQHTGSSVSSSHNISGL